MSSQYSIAAMDKILSRVSPELALFLEKMREMGQERNIPNISWNTAAFLQETLQSRRISNILEIGPANGFSTMMLALACPEAHITSIECSRHAFEELRYNIQAFSSLSEPSLGRRGEVNRISLRVELAEGRRIYDTKNPPHGTLNVSPPSQRGFIHPADFPPKVTSDINQEKIGNFSLYYGDAREVLPAFVSGASTVDCTNPTSVITDIPSRRFDCIFIDGAFRMTREFFDLSRPLLAPEGIIILDDAIKYRWKMEGFHEYLDEQGIVYELVQTDPDDGVMVMLNEQGTMNNE